MESNATMPRITKSFPKRFLSMIKKHKLETGMLLPLIIYIFYFTLTPIISTVLMSFKNDDSGAWTLGNYQAIFTDINFNTALFNTLFITIVGIILQISIALMIALLMNMEFKGKGFFRTMMLIPMGIPTLVSGVTLLFIFGQTGYFNELLFRIGVVDTQPFWLGGGINTLFVIIFADMWKVLPLTILLLLAGLQSIPKDVYEASAIDGANTWHTFWSITLPLLKPSITMAIILRAIDSFRIFELPLVMAGNNTPVLSTFSYEAFRHSNYGVSGAAATILLLIIVIFIISYILIVERKNMKEVN